MWALNSAVELMLNELSFLPLSDQMILSSSFKLITKCLEKKFGEKCFVHGAAFTGCILPHERLEITQFLALMDGNKWVLQANSSLCEAASSEVENYVFENEDSIDKIEFSASGDGIECWLNTNKFSMTMNNVSGIILTAIQQIFTTFLDKESLFLRSLILIKSWVQFESKQFSYLDLSSLFRHDALVVMTIMVFCKSKSIDNPLNALLRFLEIFSLMDWNSSAVSCLGICPKKIVTKEDGTHGILLGKPSPENSTRAINQEIERIIEHYQRFYNLNFVLTDRDLQKQDGISGIPVDAASAVGPEGEHVFLNFPDQMKKRPQKRGAVVIVMDPVLEGHNLCGSCPSVFHRSDVSNQLKTVFSKGLKKLTDIILNAEQNHRAFNSPLSDDDYFHIIKTMFPLTYSVIEAKRSPAIRSDSNKLLREGGSIAATYMAITRNLPPPASIGLSDSKGAPQHYYRDGDSTQDVDRMISIAAEVTSKKVTEEAVVNLVLQVLHQQGPMPIGEVGKHLQAMTNNIDFPKVLKKRFGGLKKFVSSHPDRFRFGDNHEYNPFIYAVGPRSALAAPVGPMPTPLSERQQIPRASPAAQPVPFPLFSPPWPPSVDSYYNSLDDGYRRAGSTTNSELLAVGPMRPTQQRLFKPLLTPNPFLPVETMSMDSYVEDNRKVDYSNHSSTLPSGLSRAIAPISTFPFHNQEQNSYVYDRKGSFISPFQSSQGNDRLLLQLQQNQSDSVRQPQQQQQQQHQNPSVRAIHRDPFHLG